MQVLIRGKKWALRFVSRLRGDEIGQCDSPEAKSRAIRIKHGLRPETELDVTIHEILHAAHWDLDEEAIDSTATDLARILWKLGYRKHD